MTDRGHRSTDNTEGDGQTQTEKQADRETVGSQELSMWHTHRQRDTGRKDVIF